MKLPLPPPQRPPNRVYPSGAPGLHGLTSVITAVVVVCGLYFGREVLIPITLAVLLSFLLAPLVGLLRRLRCGQLPSIFIAVLVALITVLAISTLIGAQVAQLAGSLPQYQAAVERKIETVQEKTVGRADAMLSRAAGALARVAPDRPNPPHEAGRTQKESPAAPMPVEVHEPMPSPLQLAQRVFSPVVGPLETMFIVLVVTIFILLQREDLRDRLIRLFGARDLHRTTTAINDAASRLSPLFRRATGRERRRGFGDRTRPRDHRRAGRSAVRRTDRTAALRAVYRHVDRRGARGDPRRRDPAAMDDGRGDHCALRRSRCGGGPDRRAAAVWAQFRAFAAGGRRRRDLLELAVGPVGLVLSTPLTLCLVTLGRYAERLRFLTVLLGDQPALTPAQNFYQRLLADDPHEAIVQADKLLKDIPLVQYYDDVAREGLRLARNDALRGVFTPDQLARMNETLIDIIENLEQTDSAPDERTDTDTNADALAEAEADAEEAEADPAAEIATPLAAGKRVLCVAGRGAFDDVCTAIALQLLARRGIGASAAHYAQFRKGHIESTGIDGATIICVVTLDASEAPPYLRNLVKRVRERARSATLIVGIGGQPERDDETGMLNGTQNVNAFAELVEQCVQVANTAPQPRLVERAG